MDLSALPKIEGLGISTDDTLTLILFVGIGGVAFILILLKIAFMSMRKVDAQKRKEFNDEISE